MTVEELTDETLAKIPLFHGLHADERRQLVGIATLHEAGSGESIVQQGQRSQRLWISVDGVCEVVRTDEQGGEVTLAELKPFEHFGEMSFFEQAPHSASVRAKAGATLLRIERADYDELINGECRSAYKLTRNIVNSLAARLRRMDEWVSDLIGGPDNAASHTEKPGHRRTEWSTFRDKLFEEWNL